MRHLFHQNKSLSAVEKSTQKFLLYALIAVIALGGSPTSAMARLRTSSRHTTTHDTKRNYSPAELFVDSHLSTSGMGAEQRGQARQPNLARPQVKPASVAEAQTYTVNSTADVVDSNIGDGQCYTGRDVPGSPGIPECTLRAAIQEANALSGKDEIIVPSGTYALSQPTQCRFRSRGDLQTYTTISLCITSQVAISGAGAGTTIIDGGIWTASRS